jgi:sorting nexin-8
MAISSFSLVARERQLCVLTIRKGLKRFINMLVNHPILREDGALSVFLTEPAFEAWRKRVKVSSDEEFVSRPPMSAAEEMRIPGDITEKLGILRDRLPALLSSHQKLVTLAERSLGRMQAASADASRIALALHTIGEEMPACCHRAAAESQAACSLCVGVGRGLGSVAEGWSRVAEEGEKRVRLNLDMVLVRH